MDERSEPERTSPVITTKVDTELRVAVDFLCEACGETRNAMVGKLLAELVQDHRSGPRLDALKRRISGLPDGPEKRRRLEALERFAAAGAGAMEVACFERRRDQRRRG